MRQDSTASMGKNIESHFNNIYKYENGSRPSTICHNDMKWKHLMSLIHEEEEEKQFGEERPVKLVTNARAFSMLKNGSEGNLLKAPSLAKLRMNLHEAIPETASESPKCFSSKVSLC
jgi:hypothetical protein